MLLLLWLILAQPVIPNALEPYPLPARVLAALDKLAAESEVLILGEFHGTQEVPAVASALLAPLSKRGYGILALEIPTDQQGPLIDWASGKTATIPTFFARPAADGRGNIQTLALIRTAIAQGWKLVCFDQSEMPLPPKLTTEDEIYAFSVRRDVTMARNLTKARTGEAKVLAICGNMHARTSRPKEKDSLHKLWPSFAAELAQTNPTWKVKSVEVVLHSGTVFAMLAEDGKPPVAKVHTLSIRKKLKEAEIHPLKEAWWDWQLDLPKATAATFLAPPTQ